jgi:homoaconitase/3-isopropylmalate dehydratase large subunit
MDNKEAIIRIETHNEIHFAKEYPRAMLITEALNMAIEALKKPDIIYCDECTYRYSTFCQMSFMTEEPYSYIEWTQNDSFCSRGKRMD